MHVIPGVSSAISVPELCGVPVTHRDHASLVTFVTGHEKKGSEGDVDWSSLVKGHGTLVILMGLENASHISDGLIKGGMSPDVPAAIVSKGSTPDQKVYLTTVSELESTIKTQKVQTPGLMVVGSVVTLRNILGDLA